MTFSDLASNINNIIQIVTLPLEIICIQVKKVISQCIKAGKIEIMWVYDDAAVKPTPYPPEKVISCIVKEIEILDIHFLPSKKDKLRIFIKYRLKIQITYIDKEDNIGSVFLEEEFCRHSAPLSGKRSMLPEADIILNVTECYINEEPDI